MRELDAHQVIKSDFVLVQSDALGNMDIASVVRAHKQRRTVDRDAIMTICAMPVPPQSRARRPGDLSVFTIVPTTSQLVHYMSVPAIPRVPLLKLPFEVFEDTRHLDVRNDLVDCGVDVCSIDVPPLFTENFDYQQLRREFVQGILSSDLLESKIFVHITPGWRAGYSAVRRWLHASYIRSFALRCCESRCARRLDVPLHAAPRHA